MRRLWGTVNTWVRHYPLPAYLVLCIGIALAFGGVDASIDKINDERDARVQVSSEINRYVCRENNKQDRILASLVEASLQGNGKSFGSEIDPSELTRFDRSVLLTIAKVQAGSSDSERLQRVFRRALAELQAETPCNALIAAFLEASDTEDYKAIRRLLFSQEHLRQDVQKAHKAGPTR
jgi:hypothetical protein